MSALTTLASVKQQGGIASTDLTRDNRIRGLIDGVSSIVNKYLNRNLAADDYTEYYTGNNSPILQLRNYPVISVTRICVDLGGYSGQASGAFPASNDLVEGVDYCILPGANGIGSTGRIRRIGQAWYTPASRALGQVVNQQPSDVGNIMVVYRAGYEQVPPAIQMAVNELVVQKLTTGTVGGGIESMSYEDGAATFFSPDDQKMLFGSISQTLGCFKSIPV
jgi:hypothetical protein